MNAHVPVGRRLPALAPVPSRRPDRPRSGTGTTLAESRPGPVPRLEAVAGFAADLMVDGRRVRVSLIGGTGTGPELPYGWRQAGEAPPEATLPVVLGEWKGRRLCLDLRRCPDALTVSGRLPAGERYALRLIRQILSDGHGVTVLGDTLFAGALPPACRRVSSLLDLSHLDAPGIVVCGRLTGRDLATARLSRAAGGPIPVLVGDVPRARWSLRIGSDQNL